MVVWDKLPVELKCAVTLNRGLYNKAMEYSAAVKKNEDLMFCYGKITMICQSAKQKVRKTVCIAFVLF